MPKPQPAKLRIIGVAPMPDANYQAAHASCCDALRAATGPWGIDTTALQPPPSRMVAIAEDESGRRFAVTEQCNANFRATVVPVERIATGFASEIMPLPRPVEAGNPEPGSSTSLEADSTSPKPKANATKNRGHRPQPEPTRDEIFAAALQGMTQRGVPADLAASVLAAQASTNSRANHQQWAELIGDRTAGLHAGTPLHAKLGEVLNRLPPASPDSPTRPAGATNPFITPSTACPSTPSAGPPPLPEGIEIHDLVPGGGGSGKEPIFSSADAAGILAQQASGLSDQLSDTATAAFIPGGCIRGGEGLPMDFDPAATAGAALSGMLDSAARELLALSGDDSAAEGIAKHLASQHMGTLKALATDPASVRQRLGDAVRGPTSAASVPVARGLPGGAPNAVKVNGRPAARIADICEMKEVPDAGPFIQGNPTVISNGMPTVGDGHQAIGLVLGTVGDPKEPSPNVFMGTATVTNSAIFEEAKAAGGSGGGASSGGAAPPASAEAADGAEAAPASADNTESKPESTEQPKDDQTGEAATQKEGAVQESSARPPADDEAAPQLSPEEQQHLESVGRRQEIRGRIAEFEAAGQPERVAQLQQELRKEAHKDRNYWQKNLAPPNNPFRDIVDPNTGIRLEQGWKDPRDGTNFGYHGNLDCYRGSGGALDELRVREDYQQWERDLAAGLPGVDENARDVRPGAQFCYDPVSGDLIDDRPQMGTFDAAEPGIKGALIGNHGPLDMEPHDAWTPEDGTRGSYNPYTQGYDQNEALDPTLCGDFQDTGRRSPFRDNEALSCVDSLSDEQIDRLHPSWKEDLAGSMESGWTTQEEREAIKRLRLEP